MQVLNIFHVLIAIAMIAFILIQKGAGATAGAAFGSGASGTVFGSRGAGNFLTHSTWVLAALFCLISLGMAVLASRASLEPQTDLGVVAGSITPAAITEQNGTESFSDLSVPAGSLEASDLPSLDAAAPTAEGEAAGDIPVMDTEAAAMPADEDNKAGGGP